MSKPSGTGPGERRLNGPQTTGRAYRALSTPDHATRTELDLALPPISIASRAASR